MINRSPELSPGAFHTPGKAASALLDKIFETKDICILAGADPGDIGLVTPRMNKAVKQAEVIVNDYLYLYNSEILK